MKFALTIFIVAISLTVGFGRHQPYGKVDSIVTVLVLPPHDAIANAGASPDTRSILEAALSDNGILSIIEFPFKKLMNVPYQMIYDKEYCKPILDLVQCDVIIMTQLITVNERKPGIWPWSYEVKVFNTITGKQINSIGGVDLKPEEIQNDVVSKIKILIADIRGTF